MTTQSRQDEAPSQDEAPQQSGPDLSSPLAASYYTDFSWMKRSRQWGTRAPRGPGGVTLDGINIGVYGDLPDNWDEPSRMPRGAYPVSGAVPLGPAFISQKSRQWADHAPHLYEESISRRWSTATDVPWETARDLPHDVELAMCQVATELSHIGSIEAEVVSSWLELLSYGFHEVKLCLSRQVFESARQFEGWRKRALLNVDQLGLESPGWANRMLLESRVGWTETCLALHVLRGSYLLTLLRYLAAYGPSEADRALAGGMVADKARHLAYGMEHSRYALGSEPDFRDSWNRALVGAEAAVNRDEDDHVLQEALAIVFGGGVRNMDQGMQLVRRMRRDWTRAYLARMNWIGLDRDPWLTPRMRENFEEPGTNGTADAAGETAG